MGGMTDTDRIEMVDVLGQYRRIQEEVDEALREVIESSRFIRGPIVASFERELATYLGGRHSRTQRGTGSSASTKGSRSQTGASTISDRLPTASPSSICPISSFNSQTTNCASRSAEPFSTRLPTTSESTTNASTIWAGTRKLRFGLPPEIGLPD